MKGKKCGTREEKKTTMREIRKEAKLKEKIRSVVRGSKEGIEGTGNRTMIEEG